MQSFLFKKVDSASLALFRIFFGILAFVDVMISYIGYHFIYPSYGLDQFRFKYFGFEWIEPFPEPLLSIVFFLMLTASVLITIGKWYRPAVIFFTLGISYVFLLEKAHYLNHAYLFIWICASMCFLPASSYWSLDAQKNPELKSSRIPHWCVLLLQFYMAVVYFFGGIAKLNWDWLNGQPLKIWLDQKTNYPIIGSFIGEDWVAYFMSYGGLALDLFVVPFLIFRRTRKFAFVFVLLFHLVNLILFEIGIFPFLSTALSLLYFGPSSARRWIRSLGERFSLFRKFSLEEHDGYLQLWQSKKKYRTLITAILGLVVITHLLLPLRHHLFKGDVAWTEEGHRYSWRMMLRTKSGKGHFLVKDKTSGKETRISTSAYGLSKRQKHKLLTHPDMIWEFAQHIAEEYNAKGQEVEVMAKIRCRLNDGKYAVYIDPEVDLANVTWEAFKRSSWVLDEGDMADFEKAPSIYPK